MDNNAEEVDNQGTREQPRPQTNWWKDIRDWAESNDILAPQQPAPIVVCPVCLNHLAIYHLPYPTSDDNDGIPDHDGAALHICGHILCIKCYREVVKTWQQSEREALKCTICRYELHFTADDCQHMMEAIHIQGTNIDHASLQDIPPTLAEGGQHPERCNKCSGERYMAVVKAAMERLGVAPPDRWSNLLGSRGRLIQGLNPEELSALKNLRLMWLGRQESWSRVWSMPGLGLCGDV